MRPINLSSKILLEGGNPEETEEILNLFGFLDGQVVVLDSGIEDQKDIIEDISAVIPQSIIVLPQKELVDLSTTNSYMTLPITREGLRSAVSFTKKELNINLAGCSKMEQAAAVYSATKDAQSGVLISGFSEPDLLINTQRLYSHSDKHVKILDSGIKDYYDFLYSLYIKPDYISASYEVLKQWAENKLLIPQTLDESVFNDKIDYFTNIHNASITGITYKELDLNQEWTEFNINSDSLQQIV